MRIYPDKLQQQLKSSLLPVYLVTGDELLLTQEACDAVRRACLSQGIEERERLEVDRGFDWTQLLDAGQSMSLFGDRKLIELRLGTAKMDQKSSALLQQYLEQSDGSNILLISCQRLDTRSLNAKWVKAIEKLGAVVQVWPVERHQLGRWITERLNAVGMNADSDAAELLADRVEGNLLAADQEIQKLKVLYGERTLDAETIASAVASSARYDIFKLIDTALAGRSGQALLMLRSLIDEGGEDVAMLGAVSRELRQLHHCAHQVENGHGIDRVLENAKVWEKRKALYKSALRRLSSKTLAAMLREAAAIDRAQKGQSDDDADLLFDGLIMRLAG